MNKQTLYLTISQQLESGMLLDDVLHNSTDPVLTSVDTSKFVVSVSKSQLPPLDRNLLTAGYLTGQLPLMCQKLGEIYEQQSALRWKLIAGTAYPISVILLSVFGLPLLRWPKEGFSGYLAGLTMSLIGLGIVIGCIIALFFFLRKFANRVPLIKTLLFNYESFKLCLEFGHLLAAGIRIDEALKQVTLPASKSLKALHNICVLKTKVGQDPFLSLASTNLPNDFSRLLLTGSKTGQLPENLLLLSQIYYKKFIANCISLIAAISTGLLVLVGCYIGYTVITIYLSYWDGLLSM